MKPLRQSSDHDVASLQAENELLRYEVRHLHARLSDSSPSRADVDARASTAERDIRSLLTRMVESPAGPVLRRYGAIQTLAQRYDVDLS